MNKSKPFSITDYRCALSQMQHHKDVLLVEQYYYTAKHYARLQKANKKAIAVLVNSYRLAKQFGQLVE